jgi:hypothetical protein
MADQQIDTRVPMGLHPAAMAARVAPEFLDDPAVAAIRDAHAIAHHAMKSTLATHDAIMRDPTFTPVANAARSQQNAAKKRTDVLNRVELARHRAQQTIQAIDEAMNRPPEPLAPHMVQLISTLMIGMTTEQRRERMTHALANDERMTLGVALCSAEPWMVGMTPAERDMWRAQYRSARYPDALERRRAIEEAVSVLDGAVSSMVRALDGLVDQKAVADAQALAVAAQQALAD